MTPPQTCDEVYALLSGVLDSVTVIADEQRHQGSGLDRLYARLNRLEETQGAWLNREGQRQILALLRPLRRVRHLGADENVADDGELEPAHVGVGFAQRQL